MSRGIVELHGGQLWCESQGLGRGSRFCFELPLVETASAGTDVAAPLMDEGRRA